MVLAIWACIALAASVACWRLGYRRGLRRVSYTVPYGASLRVVGTVTTLNVTGGSVSFEGCGGAYEAEAKP